MRSSRLLLAAAGFVLATVSVAHADTFTVYDMNSTFSSGGTITGRMTLDDTTGAWNAANLTAANFDTSNEQYTLVSNSGNQAVFIRTTAESFPDIFFDALDSFSTYIGQGSIPIDALQFNGDEDSQTAQSASLTVAKSLGMSAVPEPASLALIGTGALMGFRAFRRRLFVESRHLTMPSSNTSRMGSPS